MKIKTILTNTDHPEQFDDQVNALLAEGWVLAKREVLQGMNYNANNWARRALYAELVMLDPVEPEELDPEDAIAALAKTCREAEDCEEGGCPIYRWCQQFQQDPPKAWEE